MKKPKHLCLFTLLVVSACVALGIMPMAAFAATSGTADLAAGTGAIAEGSPLSAQNYENNSFEDAKATGCNTPIEGASVKMNDEDYYEIVVEADGEAKIIFEHEEDEVGQWTITLYSKDRYELNSWTVMADRGTLKTCSMGLYAGSYYIKVKAGGKGAWTDVPYTLNVKWTASLNWEHEPRDNDSANATPMTLSEYYKGSMLRASDIDWFKFETFEDGNVELSLSHPAVKNDESTWSFTLCDQNRTAIETVTAIAKETQPKSMTKPLTKGTYYVRVTSGGTGYTSDKTYTLRTIPVGDLKDAVIAPIKAPTYTGGALKPTPTVTFQGAVLKKDVDYKVSYKKNVKAGTDSATVIIKGKGAFKNKKTSAKFSINPANISKATAATIKDMAYDGKEKKPKPKLTFNKAKLVKDKDYTLAWKNNVKAGSKATVVVTGKGNFKGKRKVTFTIGKASIADRSLVVIGAVGTQDYTGKAVKPKPKVTLKSGTVLKKGVDYKLSYKNNAKKGTATIVIKGKGNFKDTTETTFTIGKKPITKAVVQTIADQPYAKKAIKPKPRVTYNGTLLKEGTDYTLSYKRNINRGIATVIIRGKGDYGRTTKATFEIVKGNIGNVTVARMPQQDYTGRVIMPKPKVYLDNVLLQRDVDYKFSYSNNIKKGTATITITGLKNFTGKKRVTFKIV